MKFFRQNQIYIAYQTLDEQIKVYQCLWPHIQLLSLTYFHGKYCKVVMLGDKSPHIFLSDDGKSGKSHKSLENVYVSR